MPSLIQDLKAQLATQQEGNAEGESLLQRMRRRSHPRTFGTAFTEDQFGERGLSDMALNAIPGFGLGRQVGQVVQLTEAAEAYEKETATPEQVQMLERVSDFMARDKAFGATAGEIAVGSLEALPGAAVGLGLAGAAGKAVMGTAKGEVLERVLAKIGSNAAGKLAVNVGKTVAVGTAATGILDLGGEAARALGGESAGPTRLAAFQEFFGRKYALGTGEGGKLLVQADEQAPALRELLPKAFISASIENISEAGGTYLLKLPARLRESVIATHLVGEYSKRKGVKAAAEALDKVGINGILQEIGEEVYGAGLGDLVAFASGDTLQDPGNLKQFTDLEHIAEMALGIGVGAGAPRLAGLTAGGLRPSTPSGEAAEVVPIGDPGVSRSGLDSVEIAPRHSVPDKPGQAPDRVGQAPDKSSTPPATSGGRTKVDLDSSSDRAGATAEPEAPKGSAAAGGPLQLADPTALAAPGAGGAATAGTIPLPRTKAKAKAKAQPLAPPVTAPYNPLVAEEGKHLRTKADTPKAIAQSIRDARARRRAREFELEGADGIHSVMRDIGRRFGIPRPAAGGAKSLATQANGFYQPGATAIRLRRGSYVSTFVHEVGHHLHAVLVPTLQRPNTPGKGRFAVPPAWEADLVTLGQDLYGDKKPVGGYASEGVAELARFLVFNPKHLKKRTPDLYRSVVGTLVRHHPETWKILTDARERARNAFLGSKDNPVRQHIARGAEPVSLEDRLDLWMGRLFNRHQRLRRVAKDVGLPEVGGVSVPEREALRVSGHIAGDVRIATTMHRFDPDDPKRRKTGPSLKDALEPVKDNLQLWEEYQVAKRAIEKRKQGFEVLPEDQRLPRTTDNAGLEAFIRRTEKAHPEFAQASEEFEKFNRWLIGEYAVHYGLVTPEAAKLITEKNLEYITFRVREANTATGTGDRARSGKGFANKRSGIRRFKDSKGQQLEPPLASTLGAMQGLMSRARMNHVARSLTDLTDKNLPGIGRWLHKIDRKSTPHKISADDLSSEVQRQLGIKRIGGSTILPHYMLEMEAEELEALLEAIRGLEGATFWKPDGTPNPGAREITVMVDGKPQFYEVQDQQLYDLLTGLGTQQATAAFIKMLSIPGRILRAGATQRNPFFGIPNFYGDLFSALVFTRTDMSKFSAQRRARLEGMKQAFLGGNLAALYAASGAEMSGLWGEYYDPKTNALKLGDLFGNPAKFHFLPKGKAKDVLYDLVTFGPFDRLNNALERANRLAEFSVALSQGRGALDAGQQAADLMDFQRGGSWIKQANQVIPFLNAGMVGVHRLGRSISENPMRFLGRTFSFMVLPSIVAMLLNWDDEDYWAQPMRERDRNWLFPTGIGEDGKQRYWRVKKPYGIAAFAIPVERAFAKLFAINPESGKREGDPRAFRGSMAAVRNELVPEFMNVAGLLPLLEVTAGEQGYSFFWDRPIVPISEADLIPSERGASRSTAIARGIGRTFNIAPAKVDYMIRATTGGLGSAVSETLNRPIEAITGDRGEPRPSYIEGVLLRRLIAQAPRSTHEALDRFWDDWDALNKVKSTYNALKKAPGKEAQDRAAEYGKDHAIEIAAFKRYDAARREMSPIRNAIKMAYKTEKDGEKLDETVRLGYRQLVDIAQRTLVGSYQPSGSGR